MYIRTMVKAYELTEKVRIEVTLCSVALKVCIDFALRFETFSL